MFAAVGRRPFLVMLLVPFRGFVGACNAGHLVSAYGVYDSIMHDADDLEYDI